MTSKNEFIQKTGNFVRENPITGLAIGCLAVGGAAFGAGELLGSDASEVVGASIALAGSLLGLLGMREPAYARKNLNRGIV